MNNAVMARAFAIATERGLTIMSHAEDREISPWDYRLAENIETVRNCHLAEYYGTRLHMCHVSTKESVDAIRMSRLRGARVSCEVTPHHLWFDDSRLQYKVNPPIRKAEDVTALIEAIKDGTVTCIGTDHAPHTAEEKEKGAAGMVGLETAFGVCYTKLCREPHAGQFYMLRAWAADATPILSRPISVDDFDNQTGALTFLYQVKGEGTRKLAALAAGDTLTVTGPCGNGFDTAALASAHKRIAVVGGGIGTAPLLLLCKELCRAGVRPDLYVGFRDASYGMESFVPWCHSIHLATDSGSEGHHGLVTDLLDVTHYDIVLTCGPMVMMRGVAKLCAAAGVPCLASLEKKMACGLGACLGCTCHTKIGPVTVCKDGPVFNAQEVFD